MAIKRCKESFVSAANGGFTVVPAGELLDTSDPLYRGNEANFEDVEAAVSRRSEARGTVPVERATAEPGEKRTVGRPRKAPKADELTPENAPKTAAAAEAAGVTLDEPSPK